ncbi:MAG: hypothetical protein ACSHYA_13075 [Opitutaceae bacterium]
MEFFKKNLVFCLIVAICLLAAVAGGYLAFTASGTAKSAKKQIVSAESQLNALLSADPAPSDDNVKSSQKNVAELTAQLKEIRANLQKGSRIKTSSDGIGVMSGIQQYITDYQNRVKSIVDENGESAPITVPEDFGFGFERYLTGSQPSNDPTVNAALDKQRQILSYVVNKLIDSKPAGITSVRREVLEATGKDKGGFVINEAISARVPGAIDTMAFSVTFTGYTGSLRSFLNDLAKFDLPIVVRSIEVERPQGSETTAARPADTGGLDFFGFGGDTAVEEAPVVEQKPVISENDSSFTVVLEFIEIILPSDSEKNPS